MVRVAVPVSVRAWTKNDGLVFVPPPAVTVTVPLPFDVALLESSIFEVSDVVTVTVVEAPVATLNVAAAEPCRSFPTVILGTVMVLVVTVTVTVPVV